MSVVVEQADTGVLWLTGERLKSWKRIVSKAAVDVVGEKSGRSGLLFRWLPRLVQGLVRDRAGPSLFRHLSTGFGLVH